MSAKYQIRKEIEHIKWLCRNNHINSKDKMTPIYESIIKIEEEIERS
jgi:hypothetical protein